VVPNLETNLGAEQFRCWHCAIGNLTTSDLNRAAPNSIVRLGDDHQILPHPGKEAKSFPSRRERDVTCAARL